MSTADLIFEIGTEELPADFIKPALSWLSDNCAADFAKYDLKYSNLQVEATPRRIAVLVKGLNTCIADKEIEIQGPAASLAWDGQGNLTPTALGFLRAKGVDASLAFKKTTAKGEVLACLILQKGASTDEILPEVFERWLEKMPAKRKMRWTAEKISFVRPIRWLCAVFGEKVVPFRWAGITASNQTWGHRFMSPGPFVVTKIADYLIFLRQNNIILAFNERKKMIEKELDVLAQTVQGQAIYDDDLLDCVANLVESPWPIIGHYDAKFLQVPHVILVREMQVHQKVFPIAKRDNAFQLLPYFIVVSASKPLDKNLLVDGNTRVIRARFEDGAFYYQADKKQSLAKLQSKLSTRLFEYNLGSILEKTKRIENNAAWLSEQLLLSAEQKKQVQQAAALCKADLCSGVVSEFPELQGVIGGIYAHEEGLNSIVAQAIEQHYWPLYAGAALPDSRIAAVVALADRMDTLVGIIAIGKIPSASADPFALRRAAIAILRIIISHQMNLSLAQMIEKAFYHLGNKIKRELWPKIREQSFDFLQNRMRGVIEEQNDQNSVDAALLNGVLAASFDKPLDAWIRYKALYDLKSKDLASFSALTETFKRVGNIVRQAQEKGFLLNTIVDASYFEKQAEAELFTALQNFSNLKADDLDAYLHMIKQICILKSKVDTFFAETMVMVENEKIRQNRLNILNQLRHQLLQIADFTLL